MINHVQANNVALLLLLYIQIKQTLVITDFADYCRWDTLSLICRHEMVGVGLSIFQFGSCLVDEALEADGEGVPDGARLAGGSAGVDYHAHVHQVHEARELERVEHLKAARIQFSVRSTLSIY